jgi:hypothetical protein
VDAKWGAGMCYPALILNPDDSTIDVQVFESDDLCRHRSHLMKASDPATNERSPLSTRPKAMSQRPSMFSRRPKPRSNPRTVGQTATRTRHLQKPTPPETGMSTAGDDGMPPATRPRQVSRSRSAHLPQGTPYVDDQRVYRRSLQRCHRADYADLRIMLTSSGNTLLHKALATGNIGIIPDITASTTVSTLRDPRASITVMSAERTRTCPLAKGYSPCFFEQLTDWYA